MGILLCAFALALGTGLALPGKAQASGSGESYIPAKSIREQGKPTRLKLRSHIALVFDARDKEVIFERNADEVQPIASLTKLMTAMVVLDAGQSLDDVITIEKADKDRIRYSRSRLRAGMKFTRRDLLLIALVASENRAALALGRTYPGGSSAFITAMNSKAKLLGLTDTHFSDAAGLGNDNTSTAYDMLKIVRAASEYFMIREFTTQTTDSITNLKNGRPVKFVNTNRLVKADSWPITLSKTGFTGDAGNCLVMKTAINGRPVIIVLLDSWGKFSKYGDSNRIKQWLIATERRIARLKQTASL
ncbi:MAG: peptidase S11 [Gammaproteobacteria bacterium]|nr:peptidase S11 [Gammaproteobacteria bacterium]